MLIAAGIAVAAYSSDTSPQPAPAHTARSDLARLAQEVSRDRPQWGATQATSLPDYAPAALAARLAVVQQRIEAANRIDRGALDHNAQITLDVIRWDAQREIEKGAFPWLRFPYTPYEYTLTGPPADLRRFEFRSRADAARYLALLAQYPHVMAGLAEHVRGQTAHGIYLQKDAAREVRALFMSQIRPAEQSFAWPDAARLNVLDGATRPWLQAQLQRAIELKVNPALRSFAAVFDESYVAHAPERPGMGQYPGGKEYYRALIRYHLTLDVAPEVLFSAAEAELARIESDLAALRAEMGIRPGQRELGARGDTHANSRPSIQPDVAERFASAADYERAMQSYMTRIEPVLPEMFCRPLPYGYGIARARPEEEAALSYGYAVAGPPRRGMYFYNSSNIEQRSTLPVQAITYHELAPGHYAQDAFKSLRVPSTDEAPRSSNAYQEAWAEYGNLLAYEHGLFRTPQERYGRRVFNAWFPARALVDIGINYFGRDVAWGQEVLRRHSFESEHDSRKALLRHTTDWPAQVLPYSFGAQEIVRLREHARFQLGPRFDERRFNDALLMVGEVPLGILGLAIEHFIDAERSRPVPDSSCEAIVR